MTWGILSLTSEAMEPVGGGLRPLMRTALMSWSKYSATNQSMI
jgi:hypothetical protein